MLISFQFSIIDFRDLFEDEKRNKLPIDSYIDNNGMIRNFGSVCEKAPEKKNVVTSNGKKYFSANNVIRFCDFLFKNFKLAEGAQCISRRYYNDGTAVGRFEISLTSTTKNELSIKDIKSINTSISYPANMPLNRITGNSSGKQANRRTCTIRNGITNQ